MDLHIILMLVIVVNIIIVRVIIVRIIYNSLRSSNSNTASAMDLFVLLLAAAASSLVLTSPGIEAAPQYYYPPPYNYYENYDYNNHYYPLDRIAGAPREERLKPEEIMESAQEYAKMTRTMADFIDTKGPDFLSLLGSENQQGPSSALTLRDLSGFFRKGADFMESGAATAVKLGTEFPF